MKCLKDLFKKKEVIKENLSEYKFSKRSLAHLDTCDIQLKYLALEVIKEVDLTIIDSHRNKVKQDMYYDRGASTKKFPNSKHNDFPSLAFDFIPCPFKGWKDVDDFKRVIKVIKKCAKRLKIKIRCGADFKKFSDYPHIEKVEK